jgi:hypothetical protein
VYGSLLRSGTPRDVDLIVVYGPPLEPRTAATLRGLIKDAVTEAVAIPAHVVFFSEREADEPRFASLKPRLVYRH